MAPPANDVNIPANQADRKFQILDFRFQIVRLPSAEHCHQQSSISLSRRYNVAVGGVAMRITGLLVVLLLILIFFLAAPAASYAQTAPSAKPVVSTDGKDAPVRAFQNFLRGDGTQLQMDGMCFTMRTYVVAREDKDSDVTRP